jgi:hypothetical protein
MIMENQNEAQYIRIKNGNVYLYPITTPDAVIDPMTGKTIKELIEDAIIVTLKTSV